MGKPKAPKVIKCFSNSKDNKLKRQQELAMANAVRSYRDINAQDDNDVLVHARRMQQQVMQQKYAQYPMARGRSMPQQKQQQQFNQFNQFHDQTPFNPYDKPQIYRPNPPIAVHSKPLNPQLQQQQSIHYLMDVQNALSGFGRRRSKSVPPELREHFRGYNMYGNDNEEEKIMEFSINGNSTDNSITSSKRSLTKGMIDDSPQSPQSFQEHKQAEPEESSSSSLRLLQEQRQQQQQELELQRAQQQYQQQQEERRREQQLQKFQAKIKEIQNNLQGPPVQQIQIEQPVPLQTVQTMPSMMSPQYPQPITHHLPSHQQQQQRSKTPEPLRTRLFPKINPRSKTPEPIRSNNKSPVPTTILRTARYHAEKIVTKDGNILLKKKIVHVNRTRPCVACGFREWSEEDMAYLLVRQTNNKASGGDAVNNNNNTTAPIKQQVKWLCPDCACDNGLPKEHYHYNKERLAPRPDPITDITMNRTLGHIDPEDLEWVQQAQRKHKPMNWKSQYSDYYKTIRQKQRAKQAVCCGPLPAPEEYSDDPEDDIRRVCANACYAPNYESSEVGETCYSYVGDL